MIKYLLQGFLFGIAYVAPIGVQNLYVINSSMQGSKFAAHRAALITTFFDISLAISCFWGIGVIVERFSVLKEMILLLGSIFVIYIGISLIRSSSQISEHKNIDDSLIKIIISCFAVTWLNPQALIDGSILLGGFNASLPIKMGKYFITGVCIASFTWFNSLAAFTLMFISKLNKIIKWINLICGIILIFYGLRLGYSFIHLIKSK